MANGIQQDFGGFDPAFIGATLRFSDSKAWGVLENFRASPEPLPLNDLDDEQKFQVLCISSVLSHEIRHFHDFLITPYSANVFRLRIQALTAMFQLLPDIVKSPGNCLPVPLPTWCRLDARQRNEVISRLWPRTDGEVWQPVELPYIPGSASRTTRGSRLVPSEDVTVHDLLTEVMASLQEITELTYHPKRVLGDISFQPWHILELSALTVQIQEIYYMYGVDEVQCFLEQLDSAGPYSIMYKVASAISTGPTPAYIVGAMTIWSLLGNYEVDGSKACPTYRFAHLHKLLRDNDGTVIMDDSEVFRLFDQWSQRLGLSTVMSGLAYTGRTFNRLRNVLEQYRDNANTYLPQKEKEFLYRVTDTVWHASKFMIDGFLNDPRAYVDPHRYINNVNNLANPLVRVVFESGGLAAASFEQLEQKGYKVIWAVEDSNETVVVTMIQPYEVSPHSILNVDDITELATLMGLMDFLFEEKRRGLLDNELPGRQFFTDTKIMPIEIIM